MYLIHKKLNVVAKYLNALNARQIMVNIVKLVKLTTCFQLMNLNATIVRFQNVHNAKQGHQLYVLFVNLVMQLLIMLAHHAVF